MMMTMKNVVLWDITPCSLIRTDVSVGRIASIIRVTRIGELGTTLGITTTYSSHNISSHHGLVAILPSCYNFVCTSIICALESIYCVKITVNEWKYGQEICIK
jgi:hypothetical protein